MSTHPGHDGDRAGELLAAKAAGSGFDVRDCRPLRSVDGPNPDPLGGNGMATIEQTVEVEAPIRTVYDQWTQFEEFPRFMGGVEEVRQVSDRLTHWRTSIGGVTREFDAEIVDQHPDQRVAWRSVDGTTHAGAVTFEKVDANRTRVAARIDWQPESAAEKVGAAVGVDDAQVKADLARFRKFIEERGAETGAWRGDIS
jgi:uncharacterized membrane protein